MNLVSREEIISELFKIGLSDNKDVLKALEIAENIHKDQKRDSGNPYLEEHIYVVTRNIIQRHLLHNQLKDLVIVAILHDSVEDGDLQPGYLSSFFGRDIEKWVLGVTKPKVILTEKPTQEWLYDQMKENIVKVEKSGEISQIVKIEDRIQNSQSNRIDANKRDKYLRMNREVRELFIPLARKMNPKYNYVNILENEADRVDEMFK